MKRGHRCSAQLRVGLLAALGFLLLPLAAVVAQVDWGVIEGAPSEAAPQVAPAVPPPSAPAPPAVAAPAAPAPVAPAPVPAVQPVEQAQPAAPAQPVARKPRVHPSAVAAAKQRRRAASLRLRPGFNSYTTPKRKELSREFPLEDDLDVAAILSPRPADTSETGIGRIDVATAFPRLEPAALQPPVAALQPPVVEETMEVAAIAPVEMEPVVVEPAPVPVEEPAPIQEAVIPLEELEPVIIEEPPPVELQPLIIEAASPPEFETETPVFIDADPPAEAAVIEAEPFVENVEPQL